MLASDLDAVMRIEQSVYAYPWSRANFADVLASGYPSQILWAGDAVLGYCVAMQGFQEVHLLNVAVAPQYRGQGWGRLMLEALSLWSRAQSAEFVWLEVRQSNVRAQAIYQAAGYAPISVRKAYYAAGKGLREDALVMRLTL